MTTTHTITVEPLGTELQCREDQSILDACLRNGVWLPHACTHGTCGTCKAQVLDGDIDLGDASPYALLESERDDGAALMCVATPRDDVVIEGDVDIEDGITMYPVRDFSGTVAALDEIAPGVRRLVIDLDEPMEFNAGQYVQLNLPDGDNRPYSIANAPHETGRIELHIKRTENGVATAGWVFDGLAAGDEVTLSGPYGKFYFRPGREKPVLLLGSGTGLAPLVSILKTIMAIEDEEGEWEHEVVMYHGVATSADLYDREWFEALADERDWFTYRPAVSREQFDGRQGRVPALLAQDYPRAGGNVAYICGNPAMVEDTMRALMKARLFPRDIYREDFFDAADRANGAHVVRSPLIKR
ncbi:MULTISPECIES: 2Fe-2S iron-sulfur cluster-binding protein [Gordonia]|uniref:2Fe-2S iron-sulfur cluster-binding protein n=1 Tax=Gordonia TaxID=2053 RepID=UPI0005F02F96|nr:2Fe-2S iron-sulfur cluster-binding protein [Gordonia sihwensis]KJR07746.1 oxidoreductase [Gordonia sihwensis]MBY4569252.1 oxidoreductase [Gordonia sihwensis]WFN92163.1 2Fe-2S iron-sulfur cluster-binding protein [Gordonia sihwensis]